MIASLVLVNVKPLYSYIDAVTDEGPEYNNI